MTVLQHRAGAVFVAGSLIDIAVHQVQARLEGGGAAALVVHGLELAAVHCLQSFADLVLGTEHSGRMGLQHRHAVVPVHDESGQTVAFAVDEAVAGGAARTGQSHRYSCLQRRTQGILPEGRSFGVARKRKQTHRYRTYLPVACGQILPVGGIHSHDIAFDRLADHVRHRSRENPGVETKDGSLAAVLKIYFRCHLL